MSVDRYTLLAVFLCLAFLVFGFVAGWILYELTGIL